jgi:hypothetical protein
MLFSYILGPGGNGGWGSFGDGGGGNLGNGAGAAAAAMDGLLEPQKLSSGPRKSVSDVGFNFDSYSFLWEKFW